MTPTEAAPQENTSQHQQITEEEVRRRFLVAAEARTAEAANIFFDSFLFFQDFRRGNPGAVLTQGIQLLRTCHQTDPQAYARIHKGSPFYWMGIAAFLVHDYELAAFFFDAAAAEDIRAGAQLDSAGTPAHRFILIEGANTAQAALVLTRATEVRVHELIANYNSRPGRPISMVDLSIDDVRQKFLRRAVSSGGESLRSLATAFISFVLEWEYRSILFDLRPGKGTAEPVLLHLFKGCVLFESLLKANPKKAMPTGILTLSNALTHLQRELGFSRKFSIGNSDFPTMVQELASADDSIETAITFTGRVRNTVGHNLGWVVSIDKNQYNRLFQMIGSACLHTIASIYR